MKVAKRYTSNEEDAYDILNRSFLKVLNSLDQLKTLDAYFGWTKQIAVRTAIDFVRSIKTYTEANKMIIDDENYNMHDHRTSNNTQADNNIYASEILKLMSGLPDVTREVVNMIIVDGFNHKEVAQALNISEENSRRHLNKGRNILKLLLEKANIAHL